MTEGISPPVELLIFLSEKTLNVGDIQQSFYPPLTPVGPSLLLVSFITIYSYTGNGIPPPIGLIKCSCAVQEEVLREIN